MWLQSIFLENFRNYDNCRAEFSQELNVFLGQNAQGKTNILEAIYFLALTRSHRTRQDKELIHFHADFLRVEGTVLKKKWQNPTGSQSDTKRTNH